MILQSKHRAAEVKKTVRVYFRIHLKMVLAKAIQFSSLAAQLDLVEKRSFLIDVLDSNPQMIIDALSSYFMHSLAIAGMQPDQCIKSISTIIQCRSSQSDEQNAKGFDALPSCVVGFCASFLDQNSYASLSTCNRSSYLGCNTPITLRQLNVNYWYDSQHPLLDFSAFPNANQLLLDVGVGEGEESVLSLERMNIIASQIARMPRLESLDITEIDCQFIEIIASHEATNQHTKSLVVKLWEDDEGAYDRFISSITTFKHIQFLDVLIDEPPLTDSMDSHLESLIEMCSNLKGLCFQEKQSETQRYLLQAIGHQLQYLTLNDPNSGIFTMDLKDINFKNVRELHCPRWVELGFVQRILKTAINLEKIKISGGSLVMWEILEKCERLKYLDILVPTGGMYVLDHLGRALSGMKTVQRDSLKVRASVPCPVNPSPKRCLMSIYGIINALLESLVDQWMIILELRGSNKQGIRDLINILQAAVAAEDVAEFVVVEDSANGGHDSFLITNKDCTICGWRESWRMNV